MKSNKYRCPKCHAIVKRKSHKKWIKSYCDSSGQTTRLMIVKK